ncbi:MAG: hypothetical protein E6G94_02090 [Alphaproteobacteria bacterium]|nr:MAG: hypothetical protein E6G94_02090 [Alphaproteobacteria bacterium]
MTKRDATFMLLFSPGEKGGLATGAEHALYLDGLPSEAKIETVKFGNIVRNDKRIVFDVLNGFASRPYDVVKGSRGIEWGF